MAAIVAGQIFPTLQAFKQALREWAIERNFTPHILDSDSHRVRAGCRSSPDCPFRIRANYTEKRGNAKVTTVEDVHNCVSTSDRLVSQTIKRPEVGKLKFLIEAVPKLINVDEEITVTSIQDVVEAKYGQKLPLRQAQKLKRILKAYKPKGPCRECRQMGHSKKTCPHVIAAAVHRHSPIELSDYEGGEMQIEFNDDDHERGGHQCSRCLQPGHDHENCPDGVDASNMPNGSGSNYDQQGSLNDFLNRQRQDETPIDPNLRNGHQRPNQGSSHSQATHPSNVHGQATHPSNVHQIQREPLKTPQDTRAEAARLMQQAARLMQEAAKLNFEAARLTASVANA